MFKYPNGRTVMNITIWLSGAVIFLFGLLVLVTSFIPALESLTEAGLETVEPLLGPVIANGQRVVGVVLLISSFPSLMFAEISMKTNQTNKMTRKIYDRLKQ